MSVKIDFPNDRLTTAGIGNPMFVTDVQNASQNLNQAIAILLGLPANGFAILSGFTYTPGSPGSYSSGLVYMNGVVYFFNGTLVENKYLSPNPTDTELKLHSDGNSYNTYRIYYCVSSNSSVGGMPQFVGNMDTYRRSLEVVKLLVDNEAITRNNQTGGLLTSIIDIGDWNMQTTRSVSISLGSIDFKSIRSVSVVVRNDADTFYYTLPFFAFDNSTTEASIYIFDSSLGISLIRRSGGEFDNFSFSTLSYNRGWITIQHT